MAVSLAVHGLALLALMRTAPRRAPPPSSAPVALALAPAPVPQRAPAAPAERRPTPASARARVPAQPQAAPPREPIASHAAHPPAASTLATAGEGRLAGQGGAGDEAIGEGELAGAAVAGPGGGGCDMVGRLQAALRSDRRVRAELAAAASGARALRLWNGDWIAHRGQDGRGLAAVREAILWEIGFSAPECRREQVRGLVMLVVPAETGGDVRLALGAGAWRWSDLLGLDAARPAG